MKCNSATQKFDFRWTVLGAGVVLISSISILQLSSSSGTLVAMVTISLGISGFSARMLLSDTPASQHFLRTQRLRLAVVAAILLVAAGTERSNQTRLMIISAVAVWLVSVSSFLQIATRYAEAQLKFFPYVQYIGDYWVVVFLAIWGANWMVVAGVLAFAAATAMIALRNNHSRLFLLVALSAAGLLISGIPPSGRAFSVYLSVIVVLTAWSSKHLAALASHLRSLTASASDAVVPH